MHQEDLPEAVRRALVPRMVKGGWQELIGHTITDVVVCRSERTPRLKVHLVFSDDSTFELYSLGCEGFEGLGRLYSGDLEEVLRYVHEPSEIAIYSKPDGSPQR